MAALIRRLTDESHIMTRFGDDVFTLLCKTGDKDIAAAIAEEIRSKVENHLSEVSGKNYRLSVSIGL